MSEWYELAEKKLQEESKAVNGRREALMKEPVREALLSYCKQNDEFAQAVAQGGTFADCMTAVAKGVGSHISDVEAYRRAVAFYFDGAKIECTMTIHLGPAQVEATPKIIRLSLIDYMG